MPAERLPMRKIRDVLRLQDSGFSERRIATSLNIGSTSAGEYIRRARRAGLAWPLPGDLTDEALERLLFPASPDVPPDQRPRPDWTWVYREKRKPNVTLSLLWEEYRAAHPDGYSLSHFCDLYRNWEGRLAPTMRQAHVAGEKMFVDYAGSTIDIVDGTTGEVHEAQIFVAVLGASSYTYAEATWTQKLPNWIASLSRAFAFFGGVPAQVISDNLKSGVTKACFYDPQVNRTYAEMAAHYGTAVIPARPYKPRDKAKSLPLRKRGSRSVFRSSSAGSWPSSGTGGSSRWPRPTPPSANSSTSSMPASPVISERADDTCSSNSTAPRSWISRSSPIPTPSGRNAAPVSITTSRSTSITTRCRTPCCDRSSGPG